MATMTLRQEQDAFDAQVDELMKAHHGEYVLFKDAHPVAFFASHGEAYEAGLDRFGLDASFLVAEVAKREPSPISISWEIGLALE